MQPLCVAHPGFLTAWQSQGNQTSYPAAHCPQNKRSSWELQGFLRPSLRSHTASQSLYPLSLNEVPGPGQIQGEGTRKGINTGGQAYRWKKHLRKLVTITPYLPANSPCLSLARTVTGPFLNHSLARIMGFVELTSTLRDVPQ